MFSDWDAGGGEHCPHCDTDFPWPPETRRPPYCPWCGEELGGKPQPGGPSLFGRWFTIPYVPKESALPRTGGLKKPPWRKD